MIEFILDWIIWISYLGFIHKIQKYPWDDGYSDKIDLKTKILLTIATFLALTLAAMVRYGY